MEALIYIFTHANVVQRIDRVGRVVASIQEKTRPPYNRVGVVNIGQVESNKFDCFGGVGVLADASDDSVERGSVRYRVLSRCVTSCPKPRRYCQG